MPPVFDQRNLSFAESTVNALEALAVMPLLRAPSGAIRRIQQGEDGLGLPHRVLRDDQMLAIVRVDPLGGLGAGNDGARHRHRLQHLVLDAPRYPERCHHYISRSQPSPDIRHTAGNDDAGQVCERLYLGGRIAADDCEDACIQNRAD